MPRQKSPGKHVPAFWVTPNSEEEARELGRAVLPEILGQECGRCLTNILVPHSEPLMGLGLETDHAWLRLCA